MPVKPLAQAKSRLAGVLSPEARRQLVCTMLRRTLAVLTGLPEVGRVWVVSVDAEVGRLAQRGGATYWPEPDAPELNHSLERARAAAQAGGAGGVLIIPADLPYITRQSVTALLAVAPPSPCVVIAPDRHRLGTNALLLIPPDGLPLRFGAGSFQAHLALAQAGKLNVAIFYASDLAIDLDTPEDLRLYELLDPVCC